MKSVYFFILFLGSSNFVIGMNEAKSNSLASFFGIDAFCSNQDINNKHILHHYFANKKWWYVDKEIQFQHKVYINKEHAIRHGLRCVAFNKAGTEIIGFPVFGKFESCSICVWNRCDGKEIVRHNQYEVAKLDEYQEWLERVLMDADLLQWKECCGAIEESLFEDFVDNDNGLIRLDKERKKLVVYYDSNICKSDLVSKFEKNTVYVWDIEQKKEMFQLVHDAAINSASFNHNGCTIITSSNDCTMRLWNAQTGKELLRVVYDRAVRSANFNEQGTEIVVGTDDGKIQVFAQYHPQYLSQMLLKKLLYLWLQVKKPNKEINSPEMLLNNIAALLHCDEKELWSAWNLFPENMQKALWASMYKKIQRYGK